MLKLQKLYETRLETLNIPPLASTTMVGTRRVSYHEPEAEGVSSSQNSSQNTISEITPAASTGSQTRTISQWTPDQQEQLFRAELAGKELDNRLKEAQLRRA